MKILIKLTGIILLLLIGTSSDAVIDNTGISASSKGKLISQAPEPMSVTVPMKEDFSSSPNTDLSLLQCLPSEIYMPSGGWVSGTATHVGRVNMMESPYELTQCSYNDGQLTVHCNGIITAANGDYYTYTGIIVTQLEDGSLTGEIEITGGTGKFANSTGEIDIAGNADFTTGSLYWKGEGSITFVHATK